MKFTLNFIKEFFDPKEKPSCIAEKLTLAGIEVESLTKENNDWIFQIEVTPNRADLLSIFGLANEIAAVLGKQLKIKIPSPKLPPLDINLFVENRKDCPLYIASVIKGIKVRKTPSWLKERLLNCGINSVNCVVDIGNYSMLKWGHPLHIFDLDKIEGDIFIRRAKDKESFLGLDNKERKLSPSNLVIADNKKVIALAGIIGGENSCVDENTRNILIETAIFSPLVIRKSRQNAGISTESSYRFERKVFLRLLEATLSSTINLILELCGGDFVGGKKVGRINSSSRRIKANLSSLEKHLGVKLPLKKVKEILKNLSCQVSLKDKNTIEVRPPFFREDLKEEVDIFEEVARIWGYDKLPSRIPFILPQKDNFDFLVSLKEFLVRLGLKEIITYSIVARDDLETLGEKNFIRIINPLRKEEDCLRTSLLLGMISVAKYNLNQQNEVGEFFEIAHLYQRKNSRFEEKPFLGIGVTGKDPSYIKAYVEELLKFLNISNYRFEDVSLKNFTNALQIFKEDKVLGFLGKLDKKIKDSFQLKKELFFAQLNLSLLEEERKEKQFKPFSFYPKVSRDISLAKRKDIPFKNIVKIIEDNTKELLEGFEIIDIYQGEKIPQEFMGITLRIHYRSLQKTLAAEEVDSLHNQLRKKLEEREGIFLR